MKIVFFIVISFNIRHCIKLLKHKVKEMPLFEQVYEIHYKHISLKCRSVKQSKVTQFTDQTQKQSDFAAGLNYTHAHQHFSFRMQFVIHLHLETSSGEKRFI